MENKRETRKIQLLATSIMLEALERAELLLHQYEDQGGLSSLPVLRSMRAAIAKARGDK